MNIMDMFRNAVGGQPQPQVPTGSAQLSQTTMPANPQASPNVQATQVVDPNNPNPQNNQQQQVQEKSPFEQLGDFWNIDDKTLAAAPKSVAEFAFNIKPDDVLKSSKQIDFTRAIPQDLLAKIKGGGEEAQTAMLQAMNIVAQNVFSNAAVTAARTAEAGIRTAGAQMESNLPSFVRKETISQTLREDNPLFSNPATAPMLQLLENQLSSKYPNATPQQISAHAKQYLSTFIQEGAKTMKLEIAPNSQSAKLLPGEVDWSAEPI